jgi:hypothetical protein
MNGANTFHFDGSIHQGRANQQVGVHPAIAIATVLDPCFKSLNGFENSENKMRIWDALIYVVTTSQFGQAKIHVGECPIQDQNTSVEAEVEVCIILVDDFAAKIGWAISRVDTGEIVAAAPVRSYPPLTADITVPVTLMEGVTYKFCIKDLFGDDL